MMKRIYTLVSSLLIVQLAVAQVEIDQPSVGASYANFTYYRLNDGNTATFEHNSWDIAFGVDDRQLGVFVNEGVGLSFVAPLAETELYLTSAFDFTSIDTTGMTRIYNDEVSWDAGAFNHVKDLTSPFDFGWGEYNPTTHQVTSLRFFVIKLRNGSYKKLEIQSLINDIYTFRYANLDGSSEMTQTINKADYTDRSLAYFSFESETVLDLEPAQWDLLFTRYVTPLDDGAGGTIDYVVTGVLTDSKVLVAQADGVDPTTVDHNAYENAYADTLSVIGHDWKSFQGGWSVIGDRVYFVKTAEDEIWMVQFIDFEGSSSGVSTLRRTFASTVTSLEENLYQHLSSFNVFPNPATNYTNVAFELRTTTPQARLQVTNSLGQLVFDQEVAIQSGLNVKQLDLNYPAGIYQVSLHVGKDLITQSIMIQ